MSDERWYAMTNKPATSPDLSGENDARSEDREKSSKGIIEIQNVTVLGPDDLKDEKGDPQSFEDWLAGHASQIAGRPVSYVDRQSPFLFPNIGMTDEEREQFLQQIAPSIDSFYAEFGEPPADTGPGGGSQTLRARLRRLEELCAAGVITEQEEQTRRAEIIAEAT